MADRTVKVTLTAQVAGYLAGMDKAAKATRDTSSEAEKLAARGRAFGDIGRAAMVGGAVVAAGLALAIAKFSEFQTAMSQVQAATQETAGNMELLRSAALKAGADTQYSATEAANAIEELGKAGLTTAQIVGGGLDGALTLAAAGGIAVADAAGIAAIAMKQFGLEGSQLPHVADLLAAGAGKAVGDVSDLAAALNQAGVVANSAGFSIEETTGVLAAFADAGLLGSDAGTSLKTAIVALQSPTDKARAIMDEYNLSFYDGQGQMLGFSDIAGVLQNRLGGLDDETRNAALAQIFGNDALRAANVLYAQGAGGIQTYVDQTNDAGYAAQVAADRMNNLGGDIEKLGGSFDTALIKTGSGANDVLRQLVQSATFLVDTFGSLPEPVLAVGLALGVASAATLLAGGSALVAVPKFAALKATLSETGISFGKFAGKAALSGGAMTAATLAIGYFVARAADAAATTAELTDSLDQTTGALTDYSREIVAKKLAESGAFDSAKTLGISQKELTDAVLEGGDALDEIQKKFSARNNVVDFFNGSGIAASGARDAVQTLRTGIVDSKKDFEDQAAAIDGSSESTETAAEAYLAAADEAQGLTDNLMSLIDTINAANGVGQDAVSTNAAYQKTLADVADYVEKAKAGTEDYALGLDETTAAGSANADMLRGLAEDSQSAAAAQLALDGNTETYLATVAAGRQTIYDNAIALGATAGQAQALTDKIYGIPDSKAVQILADTGAAQRRIDDFIRSNTGKQVSIVLNSIDRLGSQWSGRAEGGAIEGPGTGTSDTAGLFRLSNGEHVLTAADVAAAGGQGAIYAWRQGLHSAPGYATGGAVQYARSAPQTYMQSGGPSVDRSLTVQVGNMFGTADQIARDIQKEQRWANAAAGIDGSF